MYGPISTKAMEYVTQLTGVCLSVNISGLDSSLAQYIGALAPGFKSNLKLFTTVYIHVVNRDDTLCDWYLENFFFSKTYYCKVFISCSVLTRRKTI